ncbi:MAG: hypothetical protein M3X11_23205 [Acidobacteriota bacterium]|nr:hypothetical protein [Acidobacteriota bacterium]
MPELNDDFAKDFGEYETIQEMRDKVRENLIKQAENQADSKLRDQLSEQLLSGYDFEIPSVLVEQQARESLREMAYWLSRSGMPPQAVQGMNWNAHLADARVKAAREVRTALLISLIGEAEGVEVSEGEIDAEIERAAASTGETAEQLKARLTREEAISSIENRLRYRKSLDAVVHNAEITVEEITKPEVPELPDQQAVQPGHSEAQAEAQAAAE